MLIDFKLNICHNQNIFDICIDQTPLHKLYSTSFQAKMYFIITAVKVNALLILVSVYKNINKTDLNQSTINNHHYPCE